MNEGQLSLKFGRAHHSIASQPATTLNVWFLF
jgi:hypothetical protein